MYFCATSVSPPITIVPFVFSNMPLIRSAWRSLTMRANESELFGPSGQNEWYLMYREIGHCEPHDVLIAEEWKDLHLPECIYERLLKILGYQNILWSDAHLQDVRDCRAYADS